jgi:hypothetical protein
MTRREAIKRARAIIDSDAYSEETREAVQYALDHDDTQDLRETVRRAEAGDEVLDTRIYAAPALTPEQVSRALQVFADDLCNDQRNGDEKAAHLLAVLRAFTYTNDPDEREYMLIAAEESLSPYIKAVSKALDELASRAHQSLIRINAEQ